MNISFENQVTLVTGAASGLGLATARAFAEWVADEEHQRI
jgi:NAD(P)-dependent dehydrogenase (short-subunit alcohol dehydrogenase family)